MEKHNLFRKVNLPEMGRFQLIVEGAKCNLLESSLIEKQRFLCLEDGQI